MIEIFVDGDGCPVKDETYVVATRYGVPVALVANSRLRVPEGFGVEMVLVDQGPDAADDWIVERVRPGDVVVTGDIPLAAAYLRETGVMSGGPPAMSEKDRSRFLSKLDELVQIGLRENQSR
jgi:uncharacterized protein YaiI (UPF0178 family)